MPRFFVLPLLLVTATVWAGDNFPATPRQEFRQRKTYPYIFEPVPYLENGVPPPLRFVESLADCSRRNPPPLPKPTPKPTPKLLPTPSPAPSASPLPSTPEPTPDPAKAQPTPEPPPSMPSREDLSPAQPAFPAPENAQPVAPDNSLDMTKYPAEVVDIFKNPYNVPKSHKHVFDPIFEPAQPPPAPIPTSKATYRQE